MQKNEDRCSITTVYLPRKYKEILDAMKMEGLISSKAEIIRNCLQMYLPKYLERIEFIKVLSESNLKGDTITVNGKTYKITGKMA